MFTDGKADKNGRRRKWLQLTESNSAEVGYHAIRNLIQTMESKYGRYMKVLRTDNGGEFTSTLIDQLLFEKNIERELTAADSPQENGIAEQAITQNFIQAMCIMAHAGLMKSYPDLFGEALKHATYINNAMLVGEDTQKLIGQIPVFGSVVWVNVPKEDRTKFDYRARLGVWVGVPENHGSKSNRVYMLDTKKIVVSRHVEIWDGVMYSQLSQTEFNKNLPSGPIIPEVDGEETIPVLVNFKKNLDRSTRDYDTGVDGIGEGVDNRKESKEDVRDHGGRLLRGKMIAYEYKDGYYVIKKAGDLRKREREKWGIVTEKEYTNLMTRKKDLEAKRELIKGHADPTEVKNSRTPEVITWKPGDKELDANGEEKVGEVNVSIPVSKTEGEFDIMEKINMVLDGKVGSTELTSWNVDEEGESKECDDVAEKRRRVDTLVNSLETKAFKALKKKSSKPKNDFPRTVAEAMKRDDWEMWKEAIKKEMMSIVKMGTFRDLQSRKEWKGKALRTKIVLTIKYNTDGSIERYKARFVILGNHQVYGESYEETYAPVAAMPSVRHFINFAAKRGLPLHQLDIMTAFLNAPMDYEVDVELDTETVNVMRELAMELKMGRSVKRQGRGSQKHAMDLASPTDVR